MKKTLITVILAVLTLMILIQAGCGNFSPPINLPDPPLPDDGSHSGNNGSEEEHDIFRVFLVDESGKPFYPTLPVYAQWTGDEGVYSVEVNPEGYAQVFDLDGDYKVTLSALPANYTYDPNNNFVDNVNPDITIEIKKILGSYDVNNGSGQYKQVTLSELGTYRVSLGSQNDGVFFAFYPTAGGIYSIESWVDITENLINPIADEYNGTFAWNQFLRSCDGGGSESTYTKNFRMTMEITDDQVGNSKIFALHADTIGNNYPLTFDFTIKYEGRPPEHVITYEKVKPQGPFNTGDNKDNPTGTFTYIYSDTRILDDSKVVLNWKDVNGDGKWNNTRDEDGNLVEGDGYYHVYDPESGEMGGILYARLNKDIGILIESGTGLAGVDLRFSGYDYFDFMEIYSYYCNSDGTHPVNEELKQFLFNYAVSERLFNDGNGRAEDNGLNSGEDDQWLFACGYYA